MEFKKLGEVTLVNEATDVANVLIEENGEVKRVPKTEVGGMGYPTAIIKHREYDNYVNSMLGGGQEGEAVGPEYECINMTFEEAYDILSKGEFLHAVLMNTNWDYPVANVPLLVGFGGLFTGEPSIIMSTVYSESSFGTVDMNRYTWTASGIAKEPEPGTGPA